MKLREIVDKRKSFNTGHRTLIESVMSPEVLQALKDWTKNSPSPGVLIGGLAVSYHAIPRMTQDVDVLYLSEDDLPTSVTGFKRNRKSAYLHKKTHVEVEMVYPGLINTPINVIEFVISSSIESKGIKIASKEGMIVSKLFRGNHLDQHDIIQFIQSGDVDIELVQSLLPEPQKELFDNLVKEAETYNHGNHS